MGQYYKAALIDNEGKVKVINPSGCKLMEHSRYGNNSMMRVEKLLYRDARNVYWIGDYSNMSSLVWKHKFEDEEDRGWENRYTDDEVLQRKEGDYYYLVNHFSHEFINMTKQEMNKDLESICGVVHPLPLLCRAETEEAGGGYHSDIGREHIGTWCGDMISIFHGQNGVELEPWLEKEKGFKDMTNIYFFKE